MTDNQYVIFSGLGYPRIVGTDVTSPSKNVLGQTIETINDTQKIKNYPKLLTCPFVIFVQNKCLETWPLGNRDFFPAQPSEKFLPFLTHYNVYSNDPESMENDLRRRPVSTSSLYHERYLRCMMQENGYRYSKSRPAPIMYTEVFINELKGRIKEINHLSSLQSFFNMI